MYMRVCIYKCIQNKEKHDHSEMDISVIERSTNKRKKRTHSGHKSHQEDSGDTFLLSARLS